MGWALEDRGLAWRSGEHRCLWQWAQHVPKGLQGSRWGRGLEKASLVDFKVGSPVKALVLGAIKGTRECDELREPMSSGARLA